MTTPYDSVCTHRLRVHGMDGEERGGHSIPAAASRSRVGELSTFSAPLVQERAKMLEKQIVAMGGGDADRDEVQSLAAVQKEWTARWLAEKQALEQQLVEAEKRAVRSGSAGSIVSL